MTQVLIKRGTNLRHVTYTGALGELTFNTDTKAVHAHDGTTAGGTAMAKAADLHAYVGMFGEDAIDTNLGFGGDELDWAGGKPQGTLGGDPVTGLVGVAVGLSQRIGNLGVLQTTAKTSSVAAINELKTAVDSKQAALGYTAENAANKGQANGYASLDESGKVPTAQLPSYVDDVIEAADFASLPATGESGKIYVTLDTNNTYRWSGSAYIQIGQSVASADTALKLATPRTIALTGAVSGSVDFDGSQNVSITTVLAANTVIDCGTM